MKALNPSKPKIPAHRADAARTQNSWNRNGRRRYHSLGRAFHSSPIFVSPGYLPRRFRRAKPACSRFGAHARRSAIDPQKKAQVGRGHQPDWSGFFRPGRLAGLWRHQVMRDLFSNTAQRGLALALWLRNTMRDDSGRLIAMPALPILRALPRRLVGREPLTSR